jgi:hypothetical protein
LDTQHRVVAAPSTTTRPVELELPFATWSCDQKSLRRLFEDPPRPLPKPVDKVLAFLRPPSSRCQY